MTNQLLSAIDAEIAKLQQARELLAGSLSKRNGNKTKRKLSPEGRARIAAAVKRRWREQKRNQAPKA